MATEAESKKRRLVIATPNIPSDILENIFIRLPLNSLLRFKAVCKGWHSTIEDPIFADHHFHRNKGTTELGLATFSSSSNTKSFFCSFANFYSLDNGNSIQILDHESVPNGFASCNGLLCFIRDSTMFVCNPASGNIIRLPRPEILDEGWRMVGIGYDSCMKKFKVVCWEEKDDSKAVVLTLGPENSWRNIRGPSTFISKYGVNPYNSVYVNGATYWHSRLMVISFRYTDEKFDIITLPATENVYIDYNYVTQLCELGDRLCLMQQRKRELPVQMWFLKNFGEHEWIRQEIYLPFGRAIPIRKGEIIVDNRLEKNEADLCLHNEEYLVTTINRVDNIMGSTCAERYLWHIFHMGSLVSLNTLVSSKFFIKTKKKKKRKAPRRV